MADVQVNQSPGGGTTTPVESGGGSGAAWAIVVIVLLAIVAWFVFGRGMIGRDRNTNIKADVKVETPSTAPSTKTP
jgi:hypothetical protein